MVAGMPFTDDIIRCRLRPIDPADDAGRVDGAQLAELQAIFPDGVCDFGPPAAADVERSLIWPSIGGTRLQAPRELNWRVARPEGVDGAVVVGRRQTGAATNLRKNCARTVFAVTLCHGRSRLGLARTSPDFNSPA